MQKIGIIIRAFALLGAAVCLNGCTELNGNRSHPILPASGEPRAGVPPTATVEESAAQMDNQVKVTYTPAAAELTIHEPVVLNFNLSNGLAVPITFDLGQDRKEAFSIAVTRPDGTRVETSRLAPGGLSRIGKLTINPHQTYAQRLLLNEWHEFDAPGTYQLEVRLTAPIRKSDGQEVSVDKGFKGTLNIAARNPVRLEKLSSALLERIKHANSYEAAVEGALELSYINDPVAVPYLEKALASAKGVAPTTISGLERMASGEAVRALASALKDTDPEVSQMARSALSTIERTVKDPRVKESARRALSKPI